jgi:hypothetical protein
VERAGGLPPARSFLGKHSAERHDESMSKRLNMDKLELSRDIDIRHVDEHTQPSTRRKILARTKAA